MSLGGQGRYVGQPNRPAVAAVLERVFPVAEADRGGEIDPSGAIEAGVADQQVVVVAADQDVVEGADAVVRGLAMAALQRLAGCRPADLDVGSADEVLRALGAGNDCGVGGVVSHNRFRDETPSEIVGHRVVLLDGTRRRRVFIHPSAAPAPHVLIFS